MKKLLFMCLLVAFAMSARAAQMRDVEVVWNPPTHYIIGSDCNSQGSQIPAEDVSKLIYQIRWRINGGEFNYASTTSTAFTINGVPVGATVGVSVGAYFQGGSVLCWTDEIQSVIPPPSVGACGSVKIQVR